MTWYADEVLLRATPAALAAIKADSQLVRFSYHLQSLDDVDWYMPEHRHGLPTEGLLIIRPACNAESRGSRNWYDEPVLDTSQLTAPQDAQSLLNPQVPECLRADVETSALPTQAWRNYLATLALQLNEPVVYYSCSMWGGDIEHEYSLIYAPEESIVITSTTEREDLERRALYQGLHKVGLELPSGFFAPHTSSFDWKAHALHSLPPSQSQPSPKP